MNIILSLLIVIAVSSPGGSSTPEKNEHVGFQARLSQGTLKPGSSVEVLIVLTPKEGIHVNTDPSMEFQWNRNRYINFDSTTSLPKDEKTGYLDPSKPVRYSMTLSRTIPAGKHTVKGAVRYFFCSDSEGWCNRFVQPVEFSFTVIR